MYFKSLDLNVLTIYRTGNCTTKFFDEFTELILFCDSLSNPYLITGDFNIHVNKTNDNCGKSLKSIIELFSLHQHVSSPTHIIGNTLDLIISSFNLNYLNIDDPSRVILDHFLVSFSFNININSKTKRPKKEFTFRNIKSINFQNFNNDLTIL